MKNLRIINHLFYNLITIFNNFYNVSHSKIWIKRHNHITFKFGINEIIGSLFYSILHFGITHKKVIIDKALKHLLITNDINLKHYKFLRHRLSSVYNRSYINHFYIKDGLKMPKFKYFCMVFLKASLKKKKSNLLLVVDGAFHCFKALFKTTFFYKFAHRFIFTPFLLVKQIIKKFYKTYVAVDVSLFNEILVISTIGSSYYGYYWLNSKGYIKVFYLWIEYYEKHSLSILQENFSNNPLLILRIIYDFIFVHPFDKMINECMLPVHIFIFFSIILFITGLIVAFYFHFTIDGFAFLIRFIFRNLKNSITRVFITPYIILSYIKNTLIYGILVPKCLLFFNKVLFIILNTPIPRPKITINIPFSGILYGKFILPIKGSLFPYYNPVYIKYVMVCNMISSKCSMVYNTVYFTCSSVYNKFIILRQNSWQKYVTTKTSLINWYSNKIIPFFDKLYDYLIFRIIFTFYHFRRIHTDYTGILVVVLTPIYSFLIWWFYYDIIHVIAMAGILLNHLAIWAYFYWQYPPVFKKHFFEFLAYAKFKTIRGFDTVIAYDYEQHDPVLWYNSLSIHSQNFLSVILPLTLVLLFVLTWIKEYHIDGIDINEVFERHWKYDKNLSRLIGRKQDFDYWLIGFGLYEYYYGKYRIVDLIVFAAVPISIAYSYSYMDQIYFIEEAERWEGFCRKLSAIVEDLKKDKETIDAANVLIDKELPKLRDAYELKKRADSITPTMDLIYRSINAIRRYKWGA